MDELYREVKRSVALEDLIRAEIVSTGPMTFARFMDLALYHPELGYYRATPAPMTRGGDFLTGPETHPVFGALLARFARAAASALGTDALRIVEQGAGTGALAASVRRYWRAAYPDAALEYTIVEPDPGARERLAARFGDAVRLVDSVETMAPFEGVYWSNELPDAFPVHRVRRSGEALAEVYVDIQGDRLVEVEGPPSTPDIEAYLRHAGIHLADGAEIEVNLGLAPWVRNVGHTLQRGYALTIDYGYDAWEASRFPRGTLLAHYRHTANEEFLERIGRQDLTAHVCWTALEMYGDEAGLLALERMSQRGFLTRWGWKDFGRWLLTQANASHRSLDAVDRLGRTEDGLGNLGVLLQAIGKLPAPSPEQAGPSRWEAVSG